MPKKEISMRCGKICENNNKHNKISGCDIFDDRRKCSKSMKARRKGANHSKRYFNQLNYW